MSPPNESPHLITIIAHRGLHDFVPENSIEAFDLAREEGFPWIEFDVWSSADGIPVIMHDPTLDRTSEGAGLVSESRASELAEVPLRGADSLRRWRVPVGLPRGLGSMLIEIKPVGATDLVRRIVEAMRARPMPWMLQSFDAGNLIHTWEIDPAVPAAWLVETKVELDRAIQERWPAVHARHDLLDHLTISALKSAGTSIGAWTVNEEADVRRIVKLRVDRIITDAPRRVRRIIEEMDPRELREAR